MSLSHILGGLTVGELVRSSRDLLIPAGDALSYFSVVTLDQAQSERLVFEPFSALPPAVSRYLPDLGLILVPYLQPAEDGSTAGPDVRITFKAPSDSGRQGAVTVEDGTRCLVFLPVWGDDTYDAHVEFYGQVAQALSERMGSKLSGPFNSLLKRELAGKVRGEVDDFAWEAKHALLGLDSPDSDQAVLATYRRRALQRTLLLYLHGLCCDITVHAGPQQLPTKDMRRRLLELKEHLPPPSGVALFPEELGRLPARSLDRS